MMTDLLDPPTTEGELAPVIEIESVSNEIGKRIFPDVKCRYCDEVFTGGFSAARAGAHEKRAHPEQYVKRGDEKKASSRKRASTPAKPASPRTPKPTITKRLDASEIVGFFVGGIGQAMVMGRLGPQSTALALQWEAPIAGKVLDNMAKGTVVDRVALQPAARAMETSKAAGSVLTFPLMLGLYEMMPQMRPVLDIPLRIAAGQILREMVPILEAQEKEDAKLDEALVRYQELMLRRLTRQGPPSESNGGDPVGSFLAGFFPQAEPSGEPG